MSVRRLLPARVSRADSALRLGVRLGLGMAGPSRLPTGHYDYGSGWAYGRRGTCLDMRRMHVSARRRADGANTSTSTLAPAGPGPRVKRPSPYRLLQPHAFLAAFAPLHVKGWRLDGLERSTPLSVPASAVDGRSLGGRSGPGPTSTLAPAPAPAATLHIAVDELALGGDYTRTADLQDRRLVRVYDFPPERDGWSGLVRFFAQVGRIVNDEDHHPVIAIAPATDYRPTSTALERPRGRGTYVLEISTYTHTPMAPSGAIHPAATASIIDKHKQSQGQNEAQGQVQSQTNGTQGQVQNETQGHTQGQSKQVSDNETRPMTTVRPGVTGKDLRLAERVEAAFEAIAVPLF